MKSLTSLMLGAAMAMACDPFRGGADYPEVEVKFSEKSRVLFREPYRELREFSIKGHKVKAYSRKDAITRLKHLKKI